MEKSVLVIDDSRIVCKGLKRILEEEGCNVKIAYSGEEGVKFAEKNNFQMAIVDLVLPGINGVEACRQLKEKFSLAKIVLMSGYISKLKEFRSAFDSIGGCKKVIEKPFDSEFIVKLARDFFEHGHGC